MFIIGLAIQWGAIGDVGVVNMYTILYSRMVKELRVDIKPDL
jgi:hypothetical protein